MLRIELVDDLRTCRELWERAFPPVLATDAWDLRACFHEHFRRPACFIVARDNGTLCGLLPLSWIEEVGGYGYFPGETWKGRTWLEQNRIFARDGEVLHALLARIPGKHELRYLLPDGVADMNGGTVDEIGYLFHPRPYDHDMENYYRQFAHRNVKRLRREVAALAEQLTFRHDDLADFEALVALNLGRFGEASYFADNRFLESFRTLLGFLGARGWLRLTAILDRDQVAAVDLGCTHDCVYTLFGGGTHADYPGIAKLINLHHMEYACRERIEQVDFLCGDFSWKTLFHLTPRPLYLLSDALPRAAAPHALSQRSATHAG
jgi:hypothetical protein